MIKWISPRPAFHSKPHKEIKGSLHPIQTG